MIIVDLLYGLCAHPFFDLVTLLIENPDHGELLPDVPSAREHLIEVYLGEWSAYAPMYMLREAWALAEPLGWLHQAISYQYLLRPLAQVQRQNRGLVPDVERLAHQRGDRPRDAVQQLDLRVHRQVLGAGTRQVQRAVLVEND